MRQSTLTQQFGYEDEDAEAKEENNDPTLPLGWRAGVDKFSGKTYYIHAATLNVVFSRSEIFKKPPAAAVARRAPISLPDSVLSVPTFPSVFVVSPPPAAAGRRTSKKASKPVVINLMTTSSDSETEDEENKKPRHHFTTQDLLDIPLPDEDSKKKKPYITAQDLLDMSLPGDSDEEESNDDDNDGNQSPVLF